MSEFTCPLCGSHFFKTEPSPAGEQGRCKGKAVRYKTNKQLICYEQCPFSWPRTVEQDAKVGLTTKLLEGRDAADCSVR
jgi:hypothetical protein